MLLKQSIRESRAEQSKSLLVEYKYIQYLGLSRKKEAAVASLVPDNSHAIKLNETIGSGGKWWPTPRDLPLISEQR